MSDRGQGVENQIKELKVSGHTMTLEPGLYCVYNAPGGPAANESGLPGVRITAAPNGAAGRISISTFTPDGWIGADSGALVRVSQGRAELMVTVYQANDGQAEAPKLQVVLLSGEEAKPTPPETAEVKPASQPSANVEVVAHVYGMGDVAGALGDWVSEPGCQRWIEGFGIAPPDGIAATDIEYQAVLGRGWLSPWSQGGQFCGSRGMSLPILGLRVRLRGDAATAYRVVLAASFVDGTRVGPVSDGEPCEAESLAALEAFQVSFQPAPATKVITSDKPVRTEKTFSDKATKPTRSPKSSPVPKAIEQAPEQPAKAMAKGNVRNAPKVARTKAQPVPVMPTKPTSGKPGPKPKASAQAAPVKLATSPKGSQPVASKGQVKPGRAAQRTPATTRRR